MKRHLIITLSILLGALSSFAQQWPTPLQEAKPGTRWWWLGSSVDSIGLRWNLEQLSSHGVGAVEITPIYGVQGDEANELRYLSPEWFRALRQTMSLGKEFNVEIDLNNGTGWPFGGPWVPLEEAACKATFQDTTINGKRQVTLVLGRTKQKVKRAAPGGEGYVIDHFDSTAVAHYLAHIDSAFAANHMPFPHTMFNDSYEVYGANWTPRLPEEFLKRRGYDLMQCLDKLVDGDPQVVSDYRETLSDMLYENFTKQWLEWAHAHGAIIRNQAHGSPANLLDLYGEVDIPEIEGFGLSDFGIKGLRTDPGFTRKNFSDVSMLKYASSAAHVMGKPFVSSETFTWLTEHFRTSLSQMKPDLDLMFTCGVNHVFFHGTAYAPENEAWPRRRFYASVDMSPSNSIWRDAPYLTKYIERCQSFLQWGLPDNDFLVYLPVRDMWKDNTNSLLLMFDIHSMDKKAPAFIKAINEIDSLGFDCDYVSDRQLAKTTQENGLLKTEGGALYRGLIDPRKPISADELAKMATPEELKTRLKLRYIRRKNPTGNHYFIANLTPNDVDDYTTLAIDWKDALWFNPLNGEITHAETKDGKLHIVLRSGESMILQTFKDGFKGSDALGYSAKTQKSAPAKAKASLPAIDLTNQPWQLSFTEEAPKVSKTWNLPALKTWETLDDDSVRVTMGTGVYETSFNLNAKQAKAQWEIDLGDVRESARVYLNGQFIGCAWSAPFVLNCGNALKKGKNTLRIEVTNLPANRIADLDRQGVKWRKMKEINVVDLNYKRTTYAAWEPVKSGLNSSVRLIAK